MKPIITHSNLPTARVNDCSKVKAHKLFRLLKLFCLGSDLPLNKKNPKRLTFKYSHLNFLLLTDFSHIR